MLLQWRNQMWQSLEEGAGKRCQERGYKQDCGRSILPTLGRKHHTDESAPGKKKFRLDSNDFGFVCAGISNVVSYKRNV